jgi:hypothetical protein
VNRTPARAAMETRALEGGGFETDATSVPSIAKSSRYCGK